jgi:hypothetical protein
MTLYKRLEFGVSIDHTPAGDRVVDMITLSTS